MAFLKNVLLLSSLLSFSAISTMSYAEKLPLWELGLGVGGLHQSYYTGTKQTRSYVFPVVLPVYRGDFFKSDDKGLRAQLFEDERYKLDFSLDFNFSVDSDDIDLRQGMDDIGSLLQIGPSFEISLHSNQTSDWKLNLPLRAAFEIDDSDIDSAGYNFSPSFSFERKFSNVPLKLGLSLGVQFGDAEYNEIYYGVDAQFATVNRPAYDASSGYSGARLQAALTSKTKSRLIVLFVRYDNISGAVFDDSPLVETDDNLTVGFIYSKYLFKSKTLVNK